MKQISSILLSCLLLLPTGMNAEEDTPKQWTLRDCIDYALEHNITIQRNRISAESAQEDVKTAKADFLPSLSGNISQRVVNRPNSARGTIISGDNITTSESKTSYNGSYGIDANWTVYNGSKRVNTVKQQKLNNRIAELNVDESENSIEESITQLYVQILYSAEAVKVNESTLEVSRKEFERGQELFNVGSIASSDLAQLEAQVSSDNYQLVTSQAIETASRTGRRHRNGPLPAATERQQRPDPASRKRRCLQHRPQPPSRNRSRKAERGELGPEHQDGTCRISPDLKPQCRHRKHECQRQRLQLQRTGQAELEQLAGTDPQHPHLRQAADEKLHQQGQATKADQPAGPAGQQEDTLQNYRKPLAGRQQRTTAIRGSFTEVEEHGNQLLSRQRTIQRRHEKYSRIAHGKK